MNVPTIAPCKGCKKRFSGCHGKCKQYQGWKVIHLKELKEAKEKDNLDYWSTPFSDIIEIRKYDRKG